LTRFDENCIIHYCWLKSWLEAEEGQDLIEDVLLAGFSALATIEVD
jgi:hypothetical protein